MRIKLILAFFFISLAGYGQGIPKLQNNVSMGTQRILINQTIDSVNLHSAAIRQNYGFIFNLTGALTNYEPKLGNPAADNYVLVSSRLGVRSWVAPSATGQFMVFPGVGIALSTGSSWGTSIANNSANWNTAFSWGNHSGLYRPISYVPAWSEITGKPTTLVGYGITDAMSTSHAANAITSANINNWNAAYGWGNHSGLYAPINNPQFTGTWVRIGTDTLATRAYARTVTPSDGVMFTYPSAGIVVSDGTIWGSSITNNSANWNTAYTERAQWSGTATNLVAATARASLSLQNVTNESKATMFTNSNLTGTPTIAGYEKSLGNPSTTGYILSSTTAGTRSWIAPPSGTVGASITQIDSAINSRISTGTELGTVAMLWTDTLRTGAQNNSPATKPWVRSQIESAGTGSGISEASVRTIAGDSARAAITRLENASVQGLVAADSNLIGVANSYATPSFVLANQGSGEVSEQMLTDSLNTMRVLLNQLITAVEGIGIDISAPTIVSAELGTYANNSIAIEFSENLNQDSIPHNNRFVLRENGSLYSILGKSISGKMLYISIASGASYGGVYTLDYTAGPTSALQDSSGNKVANFTGKAITNNIIGVTSITVTGAGSSTTITTDGGTLQMSAAVLPSNAADKTVTWSVSGSGTISVGGLLTANGNGTATVRATANDGSAVYGERIITISNQSVSLGPEVLNNGNFALGSAKWEHGGGFTFTDGVCNVPRKNVWIQQPEDSIAVKLKVSTNYRLTFDIVAPDGDLALEFEEGSGGGTPFVASANYATGGHSIDFMTNATFTYNKGFRIKVLYSEAGTLDNISLKEIE